MTTSSPSKRLRWSAKGHLRRIQISGRSVHVIVEGKSIDGYFYGSLVSRANLNGHKYRIVRGDELSEADSGGKSVLLAFYDRLRRERSLAGTFKGHPFTVLFYLDKDLDDLHRRKRRSKHVVYTRTYDVEGELFTLGDVADATAAALSADPSEVSTAINSSWAEGVMRLWLDWTALCMAGQRCKAKSVCNFGAPSQVNDPPHKAVSPTLCDHYVGVISSASEFSEEEVSESLRRARESVRRYLECGDGARVFKGKWFVTILDSEAGELWPSQRKSAGGGFRKAVLSGLVKSLDYDAEWSRHYVDPVEELAIAL